MKNNLQFEWLKARKSQMLTIFSSFCLLISATFFGIQYVQQQTTFDENAAVLEKVSLNLETENREYTGMQAELRNADPESFPFPPEDLIQLNEELIAFNNHLLPYAKEFYQAYVDGDHETYYRARMAFMEEELRHHEFVNDLHEVDGEVEEGFHPAARQEYDSLAAFLAAEEPMEDEEVSITVPNHLVLLGEFILNPFVLILFVVLVNLPFIEDVGEGSLSFQLVETNSRVKWFISNRVFTFGTFLLGLVSLFLFSRLLIGILGQSVFNASPSWQAPLVINGIVQENISLGNYFIIVLMNLVVLFIFFHQILSVILLYIKEVMMSVVVFFTIGILGYFFTQSFEILQHWFNPFQLFFTENLILSGSTEGFVYCLVITLIFSFIIFLISQSKISHSPLS